VNTEVRQRRYPYNKIIATCPISGGNKIRMTQFGFDTACAKFRNHKRGALDTFPYSYCAICQGQKPLEIEICTIQEMR